MTSYIIKTIFYLAGMIGFMLIAYIVAKNCMNGGVGFRKKTGKLEIEESLAISPRKTLHIIKALDERFLVASDATSTTLLAKLDNKSDIEAALSENDNTEFKDLLDDDKQEIANNNKNTTISVMQSILAKLNN